MTATSGAPRPTRFFRDFLHLAGPFWLHGRQRWSARFWTAAMALLCAAQVALAVRLNYWSADLFDALDRRSMDRFMTQIGIFALIVAGNVLANAVHMVARRRVNLAWRDWLTRRVIADWMVEARHYQVAEIPGDHDNPDGRIAEDIRIATEYAVDLAHTLLYATLLLVTFIDVLWRLSGWVTLLGVAVPGHMVALSLTYAVVGSMVAFLLGRPLVRATDLRQTREADFRFGLVRARETAEPIALARGEARERSRLAVLFDAIGPAWAAQTQGLSRLTGFAAGYITLAPVFPILVATPRYIEGVISLGGLMQTAQAFQQVTAALSWPVDNLQRIAEWRASVERVLALEEGIHTVAAEAARSGPDAIVLDRASGRGLGARDLCVAAPDGTALLSGITLHVAPGERVLVDGDPEAAQALFRVLAGIWPWGQGIVDLPPEEDIATVGARPHLPEGTLHDALTFPAPALRHSAEDAARALSAAGLASLAPRLAEYADWERVLGVVEMQRLAFARLLLHRPRWILLGDTTAALEPAEADRMIDLLAAELPEAGVLVLGRHPGAAERFARRLTLRRLPDGEVLLHEIHARRQAAREPRRRPLPLVDWLRQGYEHRNTW
ncbi:ABC transporter ATP-binding protein/permease [Roseomonas eburnea]|uniref:ABC transporter ATP-binding protein/permease n=1 Tax=Neoroseomonas eburnea TaxID=1346889 RepID=A0A9X9XAV4_9PROT|nr:ABC transporter ATP-binding protein/permease [Neoroseomonas eburnea]MBR0680840.1 ABC transporter ATP-binding protein/permease [Neoroseomonas eburnea]